MSVEDADSVSVEDRPQADASDEAASSKSNTTPVTKGRWSWEDYKREYHGDGTFDRSKALGFNADAIPELLSTVNEVAESVSAFIDERTVTVQDDFDEDEFFQTEAGTTTVANRYDLEKAVPMEKKRHFREIERYWVNKPYAFIIIFRSTKENETKYYAVEPYRNKIEADITEYLTGKLRTAIKYGEQGGAAADEDNRRDIIVSETHRLLKRYGLYSGRNTSSFGNQLAQLPAVMASIRNSIVDRLEPLVMVFDAPVARLTGGGDEEPATREKTVGENRYRQFITDDADEFAADDTTEVGPRKSLADRLLPDRVDPETYVLEPTPDSTVGKLLYRLGYEPLDETGDELPDGDPDSVPKRELRGVSARPEPAVVAENSETLTEYQVEKLLYYLQRDFIGYERIDPIKHDINVEDISCDGYNSPVFVYHSEYEQIISNIHHGERELDDFVVKLAQRSGKGISKRRPQVDATLADGSRAQLTLGREVSDHGTNYTIRQFKEVPFTPIDLINWKTFSLDQMAFLWLAIENDKSLIFAGGTASGKTTSLNAVSLFIPSNSKIVSIEDTREVELPQRNWIASVTRPSFTDDDKGNIDEFDLLEAALRQRPEYIVMGEIRGEEGRTLFQVMSTGHTTYTTFHADSVGEVLKRFTTEPINVSKTMFSALDLVSIQTSTRVKGKKVRRNKSLTEVNHYDPENDEINVRDIYQWQAETDEYLRIGNSNTLEQIKFDRGWSREELNSELFERRVVLAYLIDRGLNTYTEVAATLQAYINDPETILALMATDQLAASLEDLREMESVLITVDPDVEALVPRPDPDAEQREEAQRILDSAESLFDRYRNVEAGSLPDALAGMFEDGLDREEPAESVEPFGDPMVAPEEIENEATEPGEPMDAEGVGDGVTEDRGDDAVADGDEAGGERGGDMDDEATNRIDAVDEPPAETDGAGERVGREAADGEPADGTVEDR